jgi:putative oxidoreductase
VRFLDKLQPLSLLALRVVLGIIFLYHGYPKLTHTHGSLQAVFVEHSIPGYFMYVSAILETFGGALLLLGLLTRPIALLLAIEMCIAVYKVHSLDRYMAVHDYEFPLALAGACFALATFGGGLLSLDHPIFEAGARSGKPRPPRGRD